MTASSMHSVRGCAIVEQVGRKFKKPRKVHVGKIDVYLPCRGRLNLNFCRYRRTLCSNTASVVKGPPNLSDVLAPSLGIH